MLRILLCKKEGVQLYKSFNVNFKSKLFIVRNTLKNCTQNSLKNNTKISSKFNNLGLTIGFGYFIKTNLIHVKCEAKILQENRLKKNDEKINFNWKLFWFYIRPHLMRLFLAVCCSLFVAYLNIKIPNLLGSLVNSLAKFIGIGREQIKSDEFLANVKSPAIKLLSLYSLQSLFTFIYIYLLSQIGERMASKLRADLFKQVLIQDMFFFDEYRTGELVNRITADVQDFKSCFKQFISQGLRAMAQLIGGSFSLYFISPQLASLALISVPVAVFGMSIFGRLLRGISKECQAQSELATSICEEAISNIRTVRSNAGEYIEMNTFETEVNKAAILGEELGFGIAIFQGMTNFFLNGMVLTTLFLGGHLVSTENLSPGQLMAFLVASQGIQRSLSQGSILLGTLIRGMTSGCRVFELLITDPKIKIKEGEIISKGDLKGEIFFDNVTFRYPSRPDQIVLKDFTLKIKQGQTVALVGSSGCGKSTCVALLERFYEPDSGSIKIDGFDIKYLSSHYLRTYIIGLIEQQPILFAKPIVENIKYGRINATLDEIIEVSKLAQSHDFIMNLQEQYETNVGERGVQLSGGQKQRIAIARALLKDPIILVLDEATSALDTKTEADIQSTLNLASHNRTTLIIAHRLSTIKYSDLIVVLDNGKIIESGNHTELMQRKGKYFNLVCQQEQEREETQ